MQPSIKSSFAEASCLTEALDRYTLDPNPKLLSDWHAFTFEAQRNGVRYILRITDDTHRTRDEVEGEIEWMSFVQSKGILVPGVIPANSGERSELIDAGPSKFTAVLFEKLDGRPISDPDWNPTLFEAWGSLVGRLHQMTAAFRPSLRRRPWYESDFLNSAAYIPDTLPAIKGAARELIATIAARPRNPQSFGMMHADVYQDNLFVSQHGLQLFDFDNCEYGFFINDVAIALYAALWRVQPEARQSFAATFLKSFWTGYNREFRLNEAEIRWLPLFLRLRDVLIYTVARKKLDLTNLTPGLAQLVQERGDRIAAKVPVVDVGAI